MTNRRHGEYRTPKVSPETIAALRQLIDDVNESIEKDRNRLSQRILRLLFPNRKGR